MRLRKRFLLFLVAIGILALVRSSRQNVAALGPPGPDRYTRIKIDYTAHVWWMTRWSNNRVECELTVDHEGLPTPSEIYRDCGKDLYNEYIGQPSCFNADTTLCHGFYFYEVRTYPASREIIVSLPAATVWVSVEGCEEAPLQFSFLCEGQPRLLLSGEEPLPNEHITRIEGIYEGEAFSCDSPCTLLLKPKSGKQKLQFWAWSSYGDSSVAYTAQIRVMRAAINDPDRKYWYVNVLSSQWRGPAVASCSEVWEAFPPVEDLPSWLVTPTRPEDLNTDIPYEYLAANLIQQGAVDVSTCPDGGLNADGSVSPCGLEAARPAITEWQNRFDALILDVARSSGVPAQMLKNLFARESQFWPGIFRDRSDIGLGQLTENGADTTLLWNFTFFDQFCPFLLPQERCSLGYVRLSSEEKEGLRLALIHAVNASCEDCPLGIDISQASFSIGIFAETLQANCAQTGRMVRNLARKAPGDVASYEDLWKFTLVNYHAGPGCLSIALTRAWNTEKVLTWETVASHLEGVCALGVKYVEEIAR